MNGSCVFKTNNAKKRQKLAKYSLFSSQFYTILSQKYYAPSPSIWLHTPLGGGGKNKMFYVFFD